MLKDLQDDTGFVRKMFTTGTVGSKLHFTIFTSTGTRGVCIRFCNSIRHSLMKCLSLCSCFGALLILVALKLEFAVRSCRP